MNAWLMEYKSPDKKLIKHFKQSRDRWKERSCSAKEDIKLLKKKVIYANSVKNDLKQENADLRLKLREIEGRLCSLEIKLNEQKKFK